MDVIYIVNSLIGIVLFAFLSTLLPRDYLIIVVIAYVLMYTAILSSIQRLRSKKKIPKTATTTTLFKVNERVSMDLILRDQELVKELNKQLWGMIFMLVASMLIVFLVIPLINSMIFGSGDQPFTERFLRYLVFYTIMWGFMYGLRVVFMPKKMVIPITKYEVYTTGIRYGGSYGNTWITFPLDQKRYRVHVDRRRGFVEIYDVKASQALRFYTEDVDKLHSIIERYGLRR